MIFLSASVCGLSIGLFSCLLLHGKLGLLVVKFKPHFVVAAMLGAGVGTKVWHIGAAGGC